MNSGEIEKAIGAHGMWKGRLAAAIDARRSDVAPEQVEYVVRDAGNRVIVTEQAFLETVLAARDAIEDLEHVVVIDGEAPEGTISIAELEEMGDPDFDFEATWRAVEPGG